MCRVVRKAEQNDFRMTIGVEQPDRECKLRLIVLAGHQDDMPSERPYVLDNLPFGRVSRFSHKSAQRMVEPRAAWRVACLTSASGVPREADGSKQQLDRSRVAYELAERGSLQIINNLPIQMASVVRCNVGLTPTNVILQKVAFGLTQTIHKDPS